MSQMFSKFYSNGHVFILPGNVLLVNQATGADFGSYTCTASNAEGSAHASTYGRYQTKEITIYNQFSLVNR